MNPVESNERISPLPRMARNVLALGAGGLTAQIAYLLIDAVIARRLGQDAYGVFATVFVISSTALLLVDFGFSWKIVQDGTREPLRIAELMGNTAVLKIALFAGSYPILLSVMSWMDYRKEVLDLFAVFYFYVLAASMQELLAAVNATRQRMHISALYQAVTPVVISAGVYGILSAGGGLRESAVVFLVGAFGVLVVWVWKEIKACRPRVYLPALPVLVRESSAIWFGSMLSQVFLKADLLVLPLLVSAGEVGLFAAGYKIVDVAYKIPLVMMRAAAPVLIKGAEVHGNVFNSSAQTFTRWLTISGVVFGITAYLAAHSTVSVVFGDQYASSANVLQVLSIALALRSANIALETALLTSNRHGDRVIAFAIATAVNLVADVILIVLFGAIGAAFGTVLSELTLLGLFLVAMGSWGKALEALRLVALPIMTGVAAILLTSQMNIGGVLRFGLVLAFVGAFLMGFRYVTLGEIYHLYRVFRRSEAVEPG